MSTFSIRDDIRSIPQSPLPNITNVNDDHVSSSSHDDASSSGLSLTESGGGSGSGSASHSDDDVPFAQFNPHQPTFASPPNIGYDAGGINHGGIGVNSTLPTHSSVNIHEHKAEMLYKLERMQKRGVKLVRRVNEQSSYDEVSREYARVTQDREVDASIRFQRMILTTCVTGIEFLNNRFDPLNVQLDGWSESVSDGINDYDEVFEELYQKYKSKAKIAPELKLMMMIGGSAVQFHMTNTLFKSMPGLDQLVKQSPDLMDHITRAAQQAAHASRSSTNPTTNGSSPPTMPSSSMRGPKDMDDFIRSLNKNDDQIHESNTAVDTSGGRRRLDI